MANFRLYENTSGDHDKYWAICFENGMTRWGARNNGSATRLPGSSFPKQNLSSLEQSKMRNGYSYVRNVELDDEGRFLAANVNNQSIPSVGDVISWEFQPPFISNNDELTDKVASWLKNEVSPCLSRLSVDHSLSLLPLRMVFDDWSMSFGKGHDFDVFSKLNSGLIRKADGIWGVLLLLGIKKHFFIEQEWLDSIYIELDNSSIANDDDGREALSLFFNYSSDEIDEFFVAFGLKQKKVDFKALFSNNSSNNVFYKAFF
jgi:hypothetical protein